MSFHDDRAAGVLLRGGKIGTVETLFSPGPSADDLTLHRPDLRISYPAYAQYFPTPKRPAYDHRYAGPGESEVGMAKRRLYSDDFRASAVIMLESQGYPHTKGALTAVAKHLNVPARTLSRWFNKENNPPPDEIVKEKRGELTERLPDLLQVFVDEMYTAANDAPLSQLATSFGIVFDKLQNLKGEPTERINHEHSIHTERSARIAALLEAARDRRDRSPAGDAADTIH